MRLVTPEGIGAGRGRTSRRAVHLGAPGRQRDHPRGRRRPAQLLSTASPRAAASPARVFRRGHHSRSARRSMRPAKRCRAPMTRRCCPTASERSAPNRAPRCCSARHSPHGRPSRRSCTTRSTVTRAGSRGCPAAVGVFYTKRGRIVGAPSASPSGQLWTTLKAGSDHAIKQAIGQLVELSGGGRSSRITSVPQMGGF